MNKNLFLVAFLFLSLMSHHSMSQSNEIVEISQHLRQPVLSGQVVENWPALVGPQFFINEWAEGSVLLKTGEVAENKWLKYDGLNDELIWFNQEVNRQVILDRASVEAFTLKDAQTGSEYYFRKLPLGITGHGKDMYAQVLTEGNFSLFILRRVAQRGVRERRHQRYTVEIPVIEARPEYLILHPDNNTTLFRRPRRSLFTSLIPGKKRELQQLLSGQDLRFSQEYDMKRAIDLINESLRVQ